MDEEKCRKVLRDIDIEGLCVLYCELRGIDTEEMIDQILKDSDEDTIMMAIGDMGYGDGDDQGEE